MKIRNLSEYVQEYQKSVQDPEAFWERIAESFFWKKRWNRVLDWNFEEPKVKWFIDAKLNITENIFESHLFALGEQPAILWEPNDPKDRSRRLTLRELYEQTCRFANGLKSLGVKKGDCVMIYMPMVPEAAVAMLACARIGAVHSVVFAGFSSQSLADRITDCSPRVVLTASGGARGEKHLAVKEVVDQAVQAASGVEKVVVFSHHGQGVDMKDGRDVWWHDLIEGKNPECPAEPMDSEDPLFILYTSGSTGKPKGILHTCGGYMVFAKYSFLNVFQYSDGDIFWCTADVGWITGHSYIVYGPLLSGATTLMFEGIPTWPSPARFWEVIDKYRVNQFYTAPTAIRALQCFGLGPVESCELTSLKVIGSVGEPINEEAWRWFHDHVGKGRCPLVDTYWQTETGGIIISPLAGVTPNKPTHASLPLPGIMPLVVDDQGNELAGRNVEGNLCVKFPWPSILRTIYGDHQRCREVYFSRFKNLYFTGDGARRDHDGYLRILGRVDDVINVSGHRLGTAEIENSISEHPDVVESAVVGVSHKIKGQGIYAFVICEAAGKSHSILEDEIRKTVTSVIGSFAKPDVVSIVPGLPKTRSGKIMRRILRKIAQGETEDLGDVSTLLNPEVVDRIVELVGGKASS